jgi:hypothetical protein
MDDTMKISRISGLAGIAVSIAGLAAADTPLPHEKVGLWEQSMTMMGHPITSQFCIDAATEAKLSVFAASISRNTRCQHGPLVHNADGSWTSTSTCEFRPGVKDINRATISGDFNSKFTETLTSLPSGKVTMNMTSTWVGPCKPGMKGGDTIVNGMKMNMLDGTSSGTPKP